MSQKLRNFQRDARREAHSGLSLIANMEPVFNIRDPEIIYRSRSGTGTVQAHQERRTATEGNAWSARRIVAKYVRNK